ncbi:MAG: phosphotransferase [Microlunatus sp.]|nr:phosphotransferase [Microlunatus sp.]
MNDAKRLREAAARQAVGDVVPKLAQVYELDGLRLAGVLPVTGRNVNAVLTDARAAPTYLARCHLRNPSLDRIGFQLDFQEHLRANGLPVPGIIPTAAGERIATIEGASWVLFQHIAGAGYDPSSEIELRSAARSLNRFHEAGQTFAGIPVEDDTIPNLRQWWTNGEIEIRELESMFAGRDVEDDLAFLTQWRERLTREFPLEVVDRLPTAWLHSDYHGDNLAFADGQVVGIFDFDVVHHSWRLDDIARAIYYFAREAAGSDVIRSSRATFFADSVGLTELERAALPAFLVAVHARTAARYRVREREGIDPVAALHQHVARMRQIQAQIS